MTSSAAPAGGPSTPPIALISPRAVLSLLALWLLATLGLRPLLLPDEGRYSEVAREMFLGDGLVPLLNGLPFFHKPPLTYWVDMAAMALIGVNDFAVRLAPALGAWLMGAALWWTVRRVRGPRDAAITLLVLATSPMFFIGAQYANHDMLVAGLITLAVCLFARAAEDPKPALRTLLLAWATCGAAVLAKGLIGVVLPSLVMLPWLLWRRRPWWRFLHPLGLLAFAAVALPWLLAMQARYAEFFDYFIMEQHFRRYALTTFNNVQPFWYYLAVVPLLTLPWSGWGLAQWRRAQRSALAQDPWLQLCLWWLVAIIGFFSLPHSKLVGYALPALAPWAMLLALPLLAGQAWRWVAAVSAALCLGIVIFLAWQAPKSNRDIGLELAKRLGAADLVVYVDENFTDVSFEAHLQQPAMVASNWDDPELPHHDNWRKELFDAARFAPAQGAKILVLLPRLAELTCRGQVLWLVARPEQASRLQAVPGATLAYQGRLAQLWRAPPRSCP